MVRYAYLSIILCLLCAGCSDVAPAKGIVRSVDQGQVTLDGEIMVNPEPDMTPQPSSVDMGVPDMEVDMAIELDALLMPDAMEVTDGDCDPRQRANACDEGFYCRPSSGFEGTCIQGDGCDLISNAGCDDPNEPQCSLIGRATLCGPAGTGIAGDDCTGGPNGVRPCAEGYLCSGSVCQEACNPQDEVCDDESRCADVSDSVGQSTGLCVERNCNIYTGRGCAGAEVCRFAVATDGITVGTCRPSPTPPRAVGESCTYGVDDDCEQGLACVQAMNGDVCRQLCDSGGYQIICPGNEVCVEALQNAAGIIRGVGLCVTNL